MADITNLSIRSKIGDMENLILRWAPRFLTPIVKLMIIKNLLLSKITHVMLSIPTSLSILELPNTLGGLSYPNYAKYLIKPLR